MGRYVRKVKGIGSIGPNEERGAAAVWIGYELVGIDDDLTHVGLERIDGWPEDRIAALRVTGFTRVEPDDRVMHERLGIGRRE